MGLTLTPYGASLDATTFWLLIVARLCSTVVYWLIAVLLIRMIRARRTILPVNAKMVILGFVALFGMLGVTQLLALAVIWYPLYVLQVTANFVMAGLGVMTLYGLWESREEMIAMPSLREIERVRNILLQQIPIVRAGRDAANGAIQEAHPERRRLADTKIPHAAASLDSVMAAIATAVIVLDARETEKVA